jgi:hypothetical protein
MLNDKFPCMLSNSALHGLYLSLDPSLKFVTGTACQSSVIQQTQTANADYTVPVHLERSQHILPPYTCLRLSPATCRRGDDPDRMLRSSPGMALADNLPTAQEVLTPYTEHIQSIIICNHQGAGGTGQIYPGMGGGANPQ